MQILQSKSSQYIAQAKNLIALNEIYKVVLCLQLIKRKIQASFTLVELQIDKTIYCLKMLQKIIKNPKLTFQINFVIMTAILKNQITQMNFQ